MCMSNVLAFFSKPRRTSWSLTPQLDTVVIEVFSSTSWQGCTYDNVVGLSIMIFTASLKITSLPKDSISWLLWPQILLAEARCSFFIMTYLAFFFCRSWLSSTPRPISSFGFSDQGWQPLVSTLWDSGFGVGKDPGSNGGNGVAAILNSTLITWHPCCAVSWAADNVSRQSEGRLQAITRGSC